MKPAIFLDRDNTLIHNDGDLGDADQVKLIQGAASAVASLRGLGYKIVVVTNQGGVARGRFSEAQVDAVHERINQIIKTTTGAKIDRFFYCPYHPDGTVESYQREHPWRKPQPGMMLQAAKEMQLDLTRSWMIGDQPRDVQAGAAAGVHTILLQPDTPPPAPDNPDKTDHAVASPSVKPEFTAPTLIEAVKIVASQRAGLNTRHATAPLSTTDPKHSPAADPTTKPREPSTDAAALSANPLAAPVSTHDAPTATAAREPITDTPLAPPAAPEPAADPAPTNLEPAPPPIAPAPDEQTPAERTLREILQELRNQRVDGSDFSYTTVLAIVLQMVTAVCLLGALWIGGPDTEVFLRWVSVGLLVQLTTIATLLFNR